MRLKHFSLLGIIGYLGFFLMGSFVSEQIPQLFTSGTLSPDSLGSLTLLVTLVNALLYALILLFYFGYFLCIQEMKPMKYLCLIGALVSLGCIANVIFYTDDYGLALGLKIMLDIMSCGVNLGFMGLSISLYPKEKPLIVCAVLAMIPTSFYPLFAAITLFLLRRDQRESNGAYR